jgi:hypothetical protein
MNIFMKKSYLILSILLSLGFWVYPQDTIRLEPYLGNLKKMETRIGNQTCELLFDTGGGETLLSPEILGQLGKAVYGRVTGYRMNGDKVSYQKCDSITLSIEGKPYFHQTLGVWDIMTLLPAGWPHLDGVISLKTFQDRILTLDVAANRLVVETAGSLKKLGLKKPIPNVRFANSLDGNELTIFLGIPEKGRTYYFLLDSGNITNILISHVTAHEWGLQSASANEMRELIPVSFRIGEQVVNSNPVAADIVYDGALNFDLMSRFIFVIDFRKQQVWIK